MDEMHPLCRPEVREFLITQCRVDLDHLERTSRLDEAGLSGFTLLHLICFLEDHCGIDFPADLLNAMETLDDLAYYTDLKVRQMSGAQDEE